MVNYSIPTEAELAEQVRTLILADLSLYDSIQALAKKIGTNPYTLQKAFVTRYSQTIFQFSRQERMAHAKTLLLSTN